MEVDGLAECVVIAYSICRHFAAADLPFMIVAYGKEVVV